MIKRDLLKTLQETSPPISELPYKFKISISFKDDKELANNGVNIEPLSVIRFKDNGKCIYYFVKTMTKIWQA